MGSFVVDFLLDAADSGVLDCAMATVHCPAVSHTPLVWRFQKLQRKNHAPLNSALLATQIPPATRTSPPMPPKRPFGGPPPPPPNLEVRRVSSFWMRAQASLGSGADITAVMSWRIGAVLERRAGGSGRRWRSSRVGDAHENDVGESEPSTQGFAKPEPLRAFPCCFLFGQTGVGTLLSRRWICFAGPCDAC
jgi:hypothetical protein